MALQPEQIGDVDEGTNPESRDEFGFTADERAAWDAMQSGERDSDGAAEPEPAPAEAEVDAPAQPDPGGVPPVAGTPPESGEGDDDGPDEIKIGADGKPQKNINFGKHQRLLTKAEQRAQQAEQRAQQQAIDNAKLAERLAILNEALTAPPPPDPNARPVNPWEEPTINAAEDAIGAVDQMQRRMIWANQNSTRQMEMTQQQLDDQAMIAGYERDVQAFTQTPEGAHFYGPSGAYQYLKNSRLIEIGLSEFDKDPSDPNEVFTKGEIDRMIEVFNQEERWVASSALNKGRSPAKSIIALAKSRGWKPAEAPAAAPPGAAAPAPAQQGIPPGRAPAAAAAAPGSAVARIKAEQAGAAASRSLSDGGGAPPPVELTPDMLVSMKDDEFAKYVDSLPKARLDALMGRDVR